MSSRKTVGVQPEDCSSHCPGSREAILMAEESARCIKAFYALFFLALSWKGQVATQGYTYVAFAGID